MPAVTTCGKRMYRGKYISKMATKFRTRNLKQWGCPEGL